MGVLEKIGEHGARHVFASLLVFQGDGCQRVEVQSEGAAGSGTCFGFGFKTWCPEAVAAPGFDGRTFVIKVGESSRQQVLGWDGQEQQSLMLSLGVSSYATLNTLVFQAGCKALN